ncbi:unnamed protein product [Hymenolepis diminuta]|uniref:Uncharacterized protein n=1 Tax=Hymenolepis diminuta TaxID=6216 RepID=A0A564Z2Y2_HYMDI|nr:unnamed protein product [Hymenolepis diminuta]
MNDKYLADDVMRPNIMKSKRYLVMLRPIFRSKVPFIETRYLKHSSNLFFFTVYLLLSIAWYMNKLRAGHNTARRMMVGLYNRQPMSVKVLAGRVPLRNLAAQL